MKERLDQIAADINGIDDAEIAYAKSSNRGALTMKRWTHVQSPVAYTLQPSASHDALWERSGQPHACSRSDTRLPPDRCLDLTSHH